MSNNTYSDPFAQLDEEMKNLNIDPDEVEVEEDSSDAKDLAEALTEKEEIQQTTVTKTPRSSVYGTTLMNFAHKSISLSEAMKEAGADFSVSKVDLTANRPTQFGDIVMPHLVAIMNDTTGDILSRYGVSKTYGLVQYMDAVSFVENLLDENTADVVYVGAPGSGSSLYVCLRAAGKIQIGSETIENYFLVTTSHDGKARLNVKITPTLKDVTMIPFEQAISFRHSKNVAENLKRATETINNVTKDWTQFEQDTQKMLKTKLTKEQAIDYFKMVIGDNDESTRQVNIRNTIYDIYASKGIGNVVAPNTVFAAYCAVVEWNNHHKTVRKSKHISDSDEVLINSKFTANCLKEQVEAYAFAVDVCNNFSDVEIQ